MSAQPPYYGIAFDLPTGRRYLTGNEAAPDFTPHPSATVRREDGSELQIGSTSSKRHASADSSRSEARGVVAYWSEKIGHPCKAVSVL